MSSGGQNGIDLSGITSMRIQNASDVTRQKQFQLTYQDGFQNAQLGANSFSNHYFHNSDQYFRQFLNGVKETCAECPGLPYVGIGVGGGSSPGCTTDENWIINISGGGFSSNPTNFQLTTGISSNGISYAYKQLATVPSSSMYAYTWAGDETTNYVWAVNTSLDPSVLNNAFTLATTPLNILTSSE